MPILFNHSILSLILPENNPQNQMGVYCNGGCGWGSGIMPLVTQACFENGRIEQGTDYLHRQAAAACKAGSFYEYWTWGKFTGEETKPGGASWYCETSSGYLDALIHGLFGIYFRNRDLNQYILDLAFLQHGTMPI